MYDIWSKSIEIENWNEKLKTEMNLCWATYIMKSCLDI